MKKRETVTFSRYSSSCVPILSHCISAIKFTITNIKKFFGILWNYQLKMAKTTLNTILSASFFSTKRKYKGTALSFFAFHTISPARLKLTYLSN